MYNTPNQRLTIIASNISSLAPKIQKQMRRDETWLFYIDDDARKATKYFVKGLKDADHTLKSYMIHWILHRYANDKKLTWEYIIKVVMDHLKRYDYLKNKNLLREEHKNLQRIPSIKGLKSILRDYVDVESKSDLKKQEEQRFFDEKKALLYYDDHEIKVIVPRTKETAIYFGVDTEWCTSSKVADNPFDRYTSWLYYIYIKGTRSKYAVYKPDLEFVTENDDNATNIKKLIDRYPIIKKIIKNSIWDPRTRESTKTKMIIEYIQRDYLGIDVLILRSLNYTDILDIRKFSPENKLKIIESAHSGDSELLEMLAYMARTEEEKQFFLEEYDLQDSDFSDNTTWKLE